MRRFRFRLQSILDLRHHVEEQKKMELGAITSRCASLRREIEKRYTERTEILGSRPDDVRSDDTVWRASVELYALRLSTEARSFEEQLLGAEEERKAAAERYRIAKRDADVLEKLKERRGLVHHDAMMKAEQLRMDEVAQNIHRRGGR